MRSQAKAELVVKRSRFIGYVCPVKSGDEAIAFVNEIRARHRDATHNVYAYRVSKDNLSRYSDDGEPQGTAGLPVLEVITKPELTDCAIVVTRYFGGVLLGTGGLVRAYGETASLAVREGVRVVMSLCSHMEINCDYSFYGRIPSLAASSDAQVTDTAFTDGVKVSLILPCEKEQYLQKQLTELSCGRFSAEKVGESYCETGTF